MIDGLKLDTVLSICFSAKHYTRIMVSRILLLERREAVAFGKVLVLIWGHPKKVVQRAF